MRTSKPTATISFNTTAYLKQKLDELTRAGKLSFWAFIAHKPEDDEAGRKEHHHVYVEPSKMLQTDDLREALKEYDPEKPDKPRGTLVWKPSKFPDWYLYALHDKRYLAMKGEARRYHYTHDDIVTSSEDDLLCYSREIDLLSLSPYADMEDAINHGLTFQQYFARGTVPIPQIRAFATAWDMLLLNKTERNGRANHEEEPERPEGVDENGEIVKGTPLDRQTEEMLSEAKKTASEEV